jgi:hypothetical protein
VPNRPSRAARRNIEANVNTGNLGPNRSLYVMCRVRVR